MGWCAASSWGTSTATPVWSSRCCPRQASIFWMPPHWKPSPHGRFKRPRARRAGRVCRPICLPVQAVSRTPCWVVDLAMWAFLDKQCKPLWNFRHHTLLPPDAMVVDDAQPGAPRFYVCDNGMLYRLDAEGQTVWEVPADGARLLTLVRDSAGKEAGLATAHAGSRTLSRWSATGRKLGSITLPLAPYAVSFVRSGGVSGFVARSANRLVFVDSDGRPRLRYSYGNLPLASPRRLKPAKPRRKKPATHRAAWPPTLRWW